MQGQPEAEILEKIRQSFDRARKENGGYRGTCRLWQGSMDRGYGLMRLTINGNRTKVYAHRAAYMLQIQSYYALLGGFVVSHLCHRKACCNPDHLSFEPQAVNNSRQSCVDNNFCYGHGIYAKCKL